MVRTLTASRPTHSLAQAKASGGGGTSGGPMSGSGPRSSAVALLDSPSGSSRFGSQRYGSQRFGSQRFGGNVFGNLPLAPTTTSGNHGLPSPRPPPPVARPSQQQQPVGAGGGPRSVSNDSALMMLEIESLGKSGVAAPADATKLVPSPPMQPRPPPSLSPEITVAAGAGISPSPRILASPSQAALHHPSPDPLADPLLQGLDPNYVADLAVDPLDPAVLDDLMAEFAAPRPPRAASSLVPQPPPSGAAGPSVMPQLPPAAAGAAGPPLGASPRVLPHQKQPEMWIDNATVSGGVDEAGAGGGGGGGGGAGPTTEATEGGQGGGGDDDGASRVCKSGGADSLGACSDDGDVSGASLMIGEDWP